MSHRYGIFSWWWAHSCPKHVEKSNTHIKKSCAPSWFYLHDYTRMHGEQNIKKHKIIVKIIPIKCQTAANYNLKLCWYWRKEVRQWEASLVPAHTTKTYGDLEVQFHLFLNSTLHGLSGQLYGRAAHLRQRAPVPTDRAKGSNQCGWTFKHRAGTSVTWWGSNGPPIFFIPEKSYYGYRLEERHIKMRSELGKGVYAY